MTNPLQGDVEGDIVQKILPTARSGGGKSDLVLWTGDGKLGLLGFGREALFDGDVFEDAVEEQGVKGREKEYGEGMRRALEMQARELRWLRGYGL